MTGMGVKAFGIGVVAAAVIAAVTSSAAPSVEAAQPEAQSMPVGIPALFTAKPWEPSYNLSADLADKYVGDTPRVAAPDPLTGRWACDLPMRIYYTVPPGMNERTIVEQLAYPVEYLQGLGYAVSVFGGVAYQADYSIPASPGTVLLVTKFTDADLKNLHSMGVRAITEAPKDNGVIESAKITVDAHRGLSSDILLHELGHVLGLKHKPDTVMAEAATDSVSFDPAETAAIDCR